MGFLYGFPMALFLARNRSCASNCFLICSLCFCLALRSCREQSWRKTGLAMGQPAIESYIYKYRALKMITRWGSPSYKLVSMAISDTYTRGTVFWWYISSHSPYIGLIYGRYLHLLDPGEFPLIIYPLMHSYQPWCGIRCHVAVCFWNTNLSKKHLR
jgi:hypothetical protein